MLAMVEDDVTAALQAWGALHRARTHLRCSPTCGGVARSIG